MKINRKGFAITGILYTILTLFLLLLSSLLAILSARVNRLSSISADISSEIEYKKELNSSDNIVNVDSNYYITNYRGKYEFTINGDENNKCYSYLPNNTLLKIVDGKIQYKVYPNDSQCRIDTNNVTSLKDLEIFECDNSNISSISFNIVNTSQEKEASGNENEEGDLAYKTLVKLGLTDLLNGEEPNFANTATEEEGIYAAVDDLGTSYYFRGASTRNYVKLGIQPNDLVRGYYQIYHSNTNTFERVYRYYSSMEYCNNARDFDCKYIYHKNDDMLWRIVRINGDGTIRIVTDSLVGLLQYDSKYNDYVYISNNGTKDDSDIKGFLDNWYETYILDKNYGSYISDSIFCNDLDVGNVAVANNQNIFAGFVFYYGSKFRIDVLKTPSLICNVSYNIDDWERAYTEKFPAGKMDFLSLSVSDRKKYSVSDGNLKYPIGLLTADEVALAGGTLDNINNSFYLYNDNSFLTMSPSNKIHISPFDFYDVYHVHPSGAFESNRVNVEGGVRPVISLRGDITLTGEGTKEDPFMLMEVCE